MLHICSVWEVQPNEVMMVGDNLKDDVSSALFLSPSFAPYLLRTFLIHFEVACGKRAGAFTCLLDKTGRYDSPEYTDVEFKPDYKVSYLAHVHSLLEANFDLTP
ncbi:unnamed protein product [Camellia sinensis]